jgi:hypothetical protein
VLRRLADQLRKLAAKDAPQATEVEKSVLRWILAGDDSRYAKLIAQLHRAEEIERSNPTPDTYRVGPTFTFDDLSFPLELDRVASDWVGIEDSVTGRSLEFRVVVGPHGFLRGLEGRTVDGQPWPSEWVPQTDAREAPRDVLKLPSIEEQDRIQRTGLEGLRRWLGVPLPASARVLPPATEAEIAAFEVRVGGALPTRFREFLRITDGLDLGPMEELHGVHDLYEAEGTLLPGIVVAWDSDDEDDFIVVVPHDGRDQATYRINVHDADARPVVIAEDFRRYLQERVAEA